MKGEFQDLYKELFKDNIQLSTIKIGIFIYIIIGLNYQFVEKFETIAYINYASTLVYITMYILLIYSKIPLKLTTQFIILVLYLNGCLSSYYFFSIGLSTLYWFTIIPLFALLVSNINNTLIWGLISILSILLYSYLIPRNLLPYIDSHRINPYYLSDQLQINITIMVFVYFNHKLFKKVVEHILENNEKLIQAKKKIEETQQSKDLFFANISHELRTPLNSIIGTATLMKNKNTDSSVVDDIDNIHFSSKLLLKIINDILDLSKLNDNKFILNPSNENLKQCIENVFHLLQREMNEKKIQYTLSFSNDFPEYAYFDKIRVLQIILNLLSNAKKFTEIGYVKLDCSIDKGNINISIIDSGIGIEDSFIKNLFNNYVQENKNISKKYGGTGLGLSISYKLAKLMQGDIVCESKKGIGSTFTFSFPYVEMDATVLPTPKIPDNIINESLTILIAEDNKMNLFIIQKLIQNHFKNFTIYTAENGLEVIEQLEKHPSIELILMDIQMPEMDGIEATKMIRKTNESIKIIALTASSFDNLVEECKGAGMNGYIIKPFEIEQLIDAISHVFSGKFYF